MVDNNVNGLNGHQFNNNNNNKTDHYSYSYSYKTADEAGVPGVSSVEVNESVTEEIGPDGTKIIRRHQQEKQINKITQVVTQRVIKRQYIDPQTGQVIEFDPLDERFANLPPETVFEEQTIRSDETPPPSSSSVIHNASVIDPNKNRIRITTNPATKSPLNFNGGSNSPRNQQQQDNMVNLVRKPKYNSSMLVRMEQDFLDNAGPGFHENGVETEKQFLLRKSHPEDNQGYPEECNMDYDPDDSNYPDDPQYEGLIPDINGNQNDQNVSPKISPRTLEMNKKNRKQSSTSSTNYLQQQQQQHHKSNNLTQQSSFKPNGLQNDQVYSSPSLNNSNDYGKFEFFFFYIKFKIALYLL
jgi:hypothetical protein